MFGRGRRQSSGNIRTMQLFHELKQQFPAIPDHVVSACIQSHQIHNHINSSLERLARHTSAIFKDAPQNHMGLSPENTADNAQESPSPSETEFDKSTTTLAKKRQTRRKHASNMGNSVLTENSSSSSASSPTETNSNQSEPSQSPEELENLTPGGEESLTEGRRKSRHHNLKKPPSRRHHAKRTVQRQETIEETFPEDITKSKFESRRNYTLSKVGYVPEQKGNFYRVTSRPSSNQSQSTENNRLLSEEPISSAESSDINRNLVGSPNKSGRTTPVKPGNSSPTKPGNITPIKAGNSTLIKPAAIYSKTSEKVNVNVSQSEENSEKQNVGNSSFFVKRPTHLDIKKAGSDFNFSESGAIPKSERCSDVHKLLNSELDNVLVNKPPRSPLREKKFSAKNSPAPRSPLTSPKKTDLPKLVETPTQTTDTLISPPSPVNLSLNVQCSVDVVQSPQKCKASLEIVPQQPWCVDPPSPRSFTSVNLTLRPPSADPQPPIDITSQNSSLTYSTSTFDHQNGLQSRLQITVGPAGTSTVSSVRARPRSSYIPEDSAKIVDVVPVRAGSLPDLGLSCGVGTNSNNNNSAPVVIRQQARIERLRIELKTEKTRLVSMQKEVTDLERSKNAILVQGLGVNTIKEQLKKEIKHLRDQVQDLVNKIDQEASRGQRVREFYSNIYTGQSFPNQVGLRGGYEPPLGSNSRFNPGGVLAPSGVEFPDGIAPPNRGPPPRQGSQEDGPKWNCHMCTFLNHPFLDKCEECDMPRVLHVSAAPGDNIHIHVTPRLSSRRMVHSWVL